MTMNKVNIYSKDNILLHSYDYNKKEYYDINGILSCNIDNDELFHNMLTNILDNNKNYKMIKNNDCLNCMLEDDYNKLWSGLYLKENFKYKIINILHSNKAEDYTTKQIENIVINGYVVEYLMCIDNPFYTFESCGLIEIKNLHDFLRCRFKMYTIIFIYLVNDEYHNLKTTLYLLKNYTNELNGKKFTKWNFDRNSLIFIDEYYQNELKKINHPVIIV